MHPTNPRYFADGAGKAVYLTGSHTWSTLQDVGLTNPPREFDFRGYLDFLEKHHHNFVRLWRWELTQWKEWKQGKPPLRYGAQHPWRRTGPGMALDGQPKFDLEKWDDSHFERLRTRVRDAGRRGIYVSIMLFEGSMLRARPSAWAGHPLNAANNVNDISGDGNGDGLGLEVQTLQIAAITDLQQEYIRRAIDAVNDLDNVLYEISNESLETPAIRKWQVAMIDYVNAYQTGKPQQHPVGMTNLIAYSNPTKAASNEALFDSAAGWVSPGAAPFGPDDLYSVNPPATTGRKVVILDTDHTWNNACIASSPKGRADRGWVWKSFLRGYNPIYMDPLDLARPNAILEYVEPHTAAVLSARAAMGHTRAYAEKMNLAAMTPHDALASSGYCLANEGHEYLIYLPDGGEVTVDLAAAKTTLAVEWFSPQTVAKHNGQPVGPGAKHVFQAPFPGDAVLYLRGN